jgi:hypothetical protein
MAWSDPQLLVVARPTFKVTPVASTKLKVVGGSASPSGTRASHTSSSALRMVRGDGFSIGVPSSWTKRGTADSVASLFYWNASTRTNVVAARGGGRAGRTFAQWQSDLANELSSASGAHVSSSIVTLPAGQAVRLLLSRTVNGVRIVQLEYAIDGGPVAYTVVFTSSQARYASDVPTFASMIASFRIG